MFRSEDNSILPVVGQYFFQLLISYPLVLVASTPVTALLSLVGLTGDHPSGTYFAGYKASACLFAGALVGWEIGRRMPNTVRVGRWIWVLPGIIVFPGILLEVFQTHPIPWLPESLFATGGNEGWGVYLFALPAFSALGYSIGMACISSKTRFDRLTRLSPVTPAATVALTLTALFAGVTLSAHEFEALRMNKWNNLRTVADRSGQWLARTPDTVCAAPTQAAGLFVPTGTTLTHLGSQTCVQGRLLNSSTERPKGAWTVERVKVLDGPKAGEEGWAPAYSLQSESP